MPTPPRVDIDEKQYAGLIDRVEQRQLREEDWKGLLVILRTFRTIQSLLQQKNIALHKLKKLLFGKKTEKDKKPPASKDPPASGASGDSPEKGSSEKSADSSPAAAQRGSEDSKPPAPGHGRRPQDSWENAIRLFHPHETLQAGEICPQCERGPLYRYSEPGVIARIIGAPPLQVEVHELERLRCSSCGTLMTARGPQEVRDHPVATPEACATAAILKYQAATPFYRFGQVLKNFRVALPRTRIWTLSQEVWSAAKPAWQALLDWAAQGEIFQNDDTKVRIQSLMKENRENPELPRQGMQTTAIVAKSQGHTAILYFSGRKHAGENLGNFSFGANRDNPHRFRSEMGCPRISRRE